MNIVERVISSYGGAAALARRLGVSRNAVSGWRSKQFIPVMRVLEVERVTGIPRHEIRPDIYPPSASPDAAPMSTAPSHPAAE